MPTFIAFSLVLFFHAFHASPLTTPSLIALNCTQISNKTTLNNNIKALLGNLTNKVEKTKFVTSKTNQFTCLMQCKLDTSQPNCSSCIKLAKSSTLGLGSSSKLVAAWFDGCYLDHAQDNKTYIIFTSFFNLSCLGKVAPKDKGHFSIETDHGIAYGEVGYVENVMNSRLEEQCGGKVEGLIVFIEGQYCLVWLKIIGSNITCSNISHGGSRSRNIENLKNGDGDYNVGHIKREFMFLWVIGFAIVATVGVCGCLVRRSIVNRAKVASISGGEGDKV